MYYYHYSKCNDLLNHKGRIVGKIQEILFTFRAPGTKLKESMGVVNRKFAIYLGKKWAVPCRFAGQLTEPRSLDQLLFLKEKVIENFRRVKPLSHPKIY